MCIRDSRSLVERRNSDFLYESIGQMRMINLFSGFGLLKDPCLLYTSDAADDLLCVDLGGRRIIKKKNNISTSIL